MILKCRRLSTSQFSQLVDFLDAGETNVVTPEDVIDHDCVVNKHLSLFLVKNGRTRNRLYPFARLISSKPSHDENMILWSVEIEIVDCVDVGAATSSDQVLPDNMIDEDCPVTARRITLEILNIIEG